MKTVRHQIRAASLDAANATDRGSPRSERRPGRVVIGGYPDGCRLVDVGHSGSINCDGWKVYLSHALSHYAVGLQAFERGYRVWFFHVLLGTFVPGTHETLQPAVVDET